MRFAMRCVALMAVAGAVLAVSGIAIETWVRHYDLGADTYAGTVLVVEDGFRLVGTKVTSMEPPAAGIVLLQIAADGEFPYPMVYQWEGARTANDALVTDDGGLLFAGATDVHSSGGTDMYVLGVGASGQTLWSGIYGSELDESATRIVRANDGSYLVLGNQVDPSDVVADPVAPGYGGLEGRCAPFVVRIEAEGQPIWQKAFRSEDNVVVFDGAATADGGCLVLATVYGYPEASDSILLLKLDDEGETVWTHTWTEGSSKGYAVLVTSKGQILITGARSFPEDPARSKLQGLLILLDEEGNELWQRSYGDQGTIDALHALAETSDGRFVAAGTRLLDYSQFSDDLILLAIDASGAVQWESQHATGEHVMVEAIVQAPNGGFVVAGTARTGGDPLQMLLVRTDREGHVDPHEE